jgi:hypothetical protein
LRTKGPSFILIKISKTPKEADNIGRIVEAPEVIKKEFMKRIRPAIKNV